MDTLRAVGAAVLAAMVCGSCATAREDATPDVAGVQCKNVEGIPGALDLALDRSHKPHRLLVSSYDRWSRAEAGEIFAVDPKTDTASPPLIRSGEPAPGQPGHFAFRPDGIDIWRSPKGEVLLAVVVHGSDDTRDQAVVLYRVNGDTLEYVDAIRDHKWLVHPRDVAFAPDGKLYVTNFGEPGRKPWSYVLSRPPSTLVMCDPAKAERRCTIIARNINGGTGVVVRQGRVIAASFFGGYLFDVDRSHLDGQIFLRRFARLPYPDHMTIADDQTLLIASQVMPAYALHAQIKANAPTAIYRLNPEVDSPAPTLLFQDDGQMIKAASAALWYGNKLYLGRSYDDGVLVVPMPERGTDEVLRCRGARPADHMRTVVENTADQSRKARATP